MLQQQPQQDLSQKSVLLHSQSQPYQFDKIHEIPVSSSVTRLTQRKQRLQYSQSQPHISSVPPCLPRREASPTRGVFNGALFSGIIKTSRHVSPESLIMSSIDMNYGTKGTSNNSINSNANTMQERPVSRKSSRKKLDRWNSGSFSRSGSFTASKVDSIPNFPSHNDFVPMGKMKNSSWEDNVSGVGVSSHLVTQCIEENSDIDHIHLNGVSGDDDISTVSGCGIRQFSNHSRTDQKELHPTISELGSSVSKLDTPSSKKHGYSFSVPNKMNSSLLKKCVSHSDMAPKVPKRSW